ncbi:MAG: fibrobacter succinogenes major paralogous domain-containing protein [Calditrichaceae bacterium]|nr:fibrobacter succinogenes major paralogous domain-containing protein [Calditrichaceae bacterium]
MIYFSNIFFNKFNIFFFLLVFLYLSCEDKSTDSQNQNPPVTSADTLKDIDGNIYETVKIGNQVWMAENLKVTRFRNGDTIPYIAADTAWSKLTDAACCGYNNSVDTIEIFGLLYNWYAVADSRHVAPEGWHIPTDEDWKALEIFLGMSAEAADEMGNRGTNEGGKLKDTGTIYWESPNLGATDETGFSALPGGYRFGYGIFNNIGYLCGFWVASDYNVSNAWSRFLGYNYAYVFRHYYDKKHGYSIRCVKDAPAE